MCEIGQDRAYGDSGDRPCTYRDRVADSLRRGVPAPAVRSWDVVDHALERRRTLQELRSGRLSETEACDASPFLQRAAKEWGTRLERPCPVCRRPHLDEICWVYGDSLGDGSGTARSRRGVALLAAARPDFDVYDVEVCQDCGWNHLLRSYRTGTLGAPPAKRTRKDQP